MGINYSTKKSSVKHAQRESFLFREISSLFLQIFLDEPEFKGFMVTRVMLSAKNGLCMIFFYTDRGSAIFKENLNRLILYKPSLRASIAQISQKRYVPEIVFRYDEQFEKQARVDTLIDTLKREGKL